ncbi:MAG TPA: GNAT family N-acetyltransferase, partial [Actinomycetota bacterium]|nr:GNAT family N-acetyltransferase [Actinomycetota bacterium]
MDAYPAFRAVDVSLRDGSTVRIRPVRPDDGPAVLDLFDRLSPDALRMRFHGLHRLTAEEVQRFTSVDYDRTFGLVAETAAGRSGVIALANYVAVSDRHAEIGIAVDDEHAGRGIGSIMIEHLGEAADAAGISVFEAEVLTSNAAMLEVLRQMRLPVEQSVASGVVHFEFPTSPTPEAVEAFELREGIAAAAAVARFFTPRSVAVLGASRRRGTIGGELFHNILEMGFEGPVYPINPSADVVQSVAAYRTLDDIPGPVDLAVIVVPAVHVLEAARACGAKGVGALLIISSGFSEIGAEGRELQRELLSIARGHGMRIVGPNCMGLINADPTVSLNATFSPIYPDSGRLAFSSQSGALGIAVIDRARQLGLGMSTFVSVGNKADISGNDLLQYWEQDDGTDVILLYLESFGNPRKFARIARRVSKNKPIVAVKSGRSTAGARAAASHTGSFAA